MESPATFSIRDSISSMSSFFSESLWSCAEATSSRSCRHLELWSLYFRARSSFSPLNLSASLDFNSNSALAKLSCFLRSSTSEAWASISEAWASNFSARARRSSPLALPALSLPATRSLIWAS